MGTAYSMPCRRCSSTARRWLDAEGTRDGSDDAFEQTRFLIGRLRRRRGGGRRRAQQFVVALVGVYGVTAQAARQRLPELGLRMALGARAVDVVRLTLGRSIILVAIGLGAGVAAALVATRVMAGMLYGVTPNDPATFIAGPLLFAAAALGASWLPARRAARVDPARTLQSVE